MLNSSGSGAFMPIQMSSIGDGPAEQSPETHRPVNLLEDPEGADGADGEGEEGDEDLEF